MDRPKRTLGFEPQTPPPMYSSVVGPSSMEYTLIPGSNPKIPPIFEAPNATAPYPDTPVSRFSPYPVFVPTPQRTTGYVPHTVKREYHRPFPERVCVPDTYGFASDVIGNRRSLQRNVVWNPLEQGYKEGSPKFCILLVCCVLIVLFTLIGVTVRLSKKYGG